jgi:hypothetical protein
LGNGHLEYVLGEIDSYGRRIHDIVLLVMTLTSQRLRPIMPENREESMPSYIYVRVEGRSFARDRSLSRPTVLPAFCGTMGGPGRRSG